MNHDLCTYSSENEEKLDLTPYCTCILECKRMLTWLVMVSYTVTKFLTVCTVCAFGSDGGGVRIDVVRWWFVLKLAK